MSPKQKFEFGAGEYENAKKTARELKRLLKKLLAGTLISNGRMKIVDIDMPGDDRKDEIAYFGSWSVIVEYVDSHKITKLPLRHYIPCDKLYAMFRQSFKSVVAPIATPFFKLIQREKFPELAKELFAWTEGEGLADLEIVKLRWMQEFILSPVRRVSHSPWAELKVAIDRNGLLAELEPHRIHYRPDPEEYFGEADVCDSTLAAYVDPLQRYYPIAHIAVGLPGTIGSKQVLNSVELLLAPGIKWKRI